MKSLPSSWKYLLSSLFLIAVTVWISFLTFPEENLKIVACDVGQGDAILIIHKDAQILIDGGPNKDVIGCLDRNMPFWDREIEAVVLTHPQTDHFRGLIEVFKNYRVEVFVHSGLDASSRDLQVLKEAVGGSGVRVVNATSGNFIRLGVIQFDIVHPSDEFLASNTQKKEVDNGVGSTQVLGAFTTNKDSNDLSVVGMLRFREFDALLTGDIGPKVSDMVAQELGQKGYGSFCSGECRDIEYIKIPHHGSKNGLTEKLLDAADPQVAVISSGKNNRYGHPHREVIELLSDQGVKFFRTDEIGDVEIITDGERIWLERQ